MPFAYSSDRLFCEEVALRSLAEQFGTPLYVYSRQAIVENCRVLDEAFGGLPHFISYAIKANNNPHILKVIAEQGLGADAGSKGELFLALHAGFPASSVSFSGVGKREDEIAYGLENGIRAFHVESEEELDRLAALAERSGTTANIFLRVNLDIDGGTHDYISTSRKHNKFGISAGTVAQVLKRAQQCSRITIRGIHSHIGSQITNVESFVAAAQALRSLVDDLRSQHIPVDEIDFGGGFGIQYHGVLVHPQLPYEKPEAKHISPASVIRTVLPPLRESGCRISIQPGRSIVGNAGVLLTTVLYRKETEEKTFVIVDAGMNDLIRPSLYQAHHQIVPVELRNARFENVDVVGPCCESGDFFAHERALPHVERNDVLALLCAGAYGFALSSNYNARLRPAEVLVDGKSVVLIREREHLESFIQGRST